MMLSQLEVLNFVTLSHEHVQKIIFLVQSVYFHFQSLYAFLIHTYFIQKQTDFIYHSPFIKDSYLLGGKC